MARSDKTLEALPDYQAMKKAPSKAKVTNLLSEGHQLRRAVKDAEERMKEIKSELTQIQILNDLPGLRYGTMCFIASERKGRSSLSKELLIDHGVSPQTIADCTVAGAPYMQTELVVIGEKSEKENE